jgi:CHAT domain-containing protein
MVDRWPALAASATLNLKAELLAFPDAIVLPVERRSGNGFTGVAWASYVAGSPAMLVSHWQAENTEWLTKFHQQAKARTPNALQQAMIKLLNSNEYRHPVHWAGFVALGVIR